MPTTVDEYYKDFVVNEADHIKKYHEQIALYCAQRENNKAAEAATTSERARFDAQESLRRVQEAREDFRKRDDHFKQSEHGKDIDRKLEQDQKRYSDLSKRSLEDRYKTERAQMEEIREHVKGGEEMPQRMRPPSHGASHDPAKNNLDALRGKLKQGGGSNSEGGAPAAPIGQGPNDGVPDPKTASPGEAKRETMAEKFARQDEEAKMRMKPAGVRP